MEKLGLGDPDTPDERSWQLLPLPSAFVYTTCIGKRGEMQMESSWVQLHGQQEQSSCGMLLFSTDYPDQVSVSCCSCKAALPSLAYFFVPGPCLLSTKGLDMAMLTSTFLLSRFSYWSPHWGAMITLCPSPPFLPKGLGTSLAFPPRLQDGRGDTGSGLSLVFHHLSDDGCIARYWMQNLVSLEALEDLLCSPTAAAPIHAVQSFGPHHGPLRPRVTL
jgi:hypothetical protein